MMKYANYEVVRKKHNEYHYSIPMIFGNSFPPDKGQLKPVYKRRDIKNKTDMIKVF